MCMFNFHVFVMLHRQVLLPQDGLDEQTRLRSNTGTCVCGLVCVCGC